MQVDKSRGNDETARIKFFVGASPDLIRQSNFGNAAIAQ